MISKSVTRLGRQRRRPRHLVSLLHGVQQIPDFHIVHRGQARLPFEAHIGESLYVFGRKTFKLALVIAEDRAEKILTGPRDSQRVSDHGGGR
jgi:hypothetical protein